MAPKCPICLYLFFEERKPITITCGHTVCKECLDRMVRTQKMYRCPECRQDYNEHLSKALLDLQPNFQIVQMMDNLKTRCWLHGALAEKVCMQHVQALCENCSGHNGCRVLAIDEDFESIQRDLDKALRKLRKKNQLPKDLSDGIERALKKSLNDLLKLCKAVNVHINGPDLSDPREALLNEGARDLAKVHSCLLSRDLLSLWKNPPDSQADINQLIKQIHQFVGMPLESEDSLPDVVCCMQCLNSVAKEHMNFMQLPCYQVYHVICESCAKPQIASGLVTCALDGRSFRVDRLSTFTPPASTKDGSRLTAYPAQDFFGYCHYVNLFQHVMPPERLPETHRIGNFRGYTVDFSVNQVEAISFTIFANTNIGGIGLANPVDAGNQVTVEWVKIYLGDAASGLPRMTTLAFPRLLTGASGVLTNLLFQEEFQASAMATYTIKVKLTGQSPNNKMLFYRGNHLTRCVNAKGSKDKDGDPWEFIQTAGFDKGERCTGQHFITGPILRILYR